MDRTLKYLSTWDTLIASAVGVYLVYLFTKYSGVGISPDSIMYTSAARSMVHTGKLITFNNTPITDFPVFYPLFLSAVLAVTGVDPFVAGAAINCVLFAITIFLSGWIVQRFNPSSWIYKWLMLIGIVLSPALLQVFTFLWSETLFILISLIFIIAARQYFVKHTWGTLIVFALMAAIGVITRYAGITLVGAGGLALLLDRALPIRKKIIHIVVYSVVSVSLLVGNILMNQLLTGKTTGPREPSVTSFGKNVYYFGTVLCDWAGLPASAYVFATAIAWLVLLFLTGTIIWFYLKRDEGSYENLATIFAWMYCWFIIISSTLSRYERINTRLIAPCFIPLLLSCTWWGVSAVKRSRGAWKYPAATILIVLMLGFSWYELYDDDANSPNSIEGDLQRLDDEDGFGIPGYSDDSWNKSEMGAFLRKNMGIFKKGIPIYSDANDAVFFVTGHSVNLLPHRFFTGSIEKFYQQKRFYLIWFKDMDNPELISIKDIVKVKNLQELKKFPEGGIYLYEEK